MVLLDSTDAFFGELEQMFALCKERGAGTVYVTLKKVEVTGREVKGAKGGRRAGWLARAKISNNKARKISASVRMEFPVCFLLRVIPTLARIGDR